MTDLPELAERAGQHLVKRSVVLRGGIVGAVLYGGLTLELSISGLFNPHLHESLLGTVAGLLLGLAAGAGMGLLYTAGIHRFARPRLGAHVLAGIAAAPVVIVPPTILLRHFLVPHATLVGALGVLVFGGSVGTMIRLYMYNKHRRDAA